MTNPSISNNLKTTLIYHQETKHNYYRFASGPGYLDWETQPNPFRRYQDAPMIELAKIPLEDTPRYELAFAGGHISAAPLNKQSISQLLFDSLAISAWKAVGDVRWALRVNPSSGNLHPTEGYLICGPVRDLCQTPMVCHYAPKAHLLERRATFSEEIWQALTVNLPPNCILIGLSSIHWREAWKYGERAFRYCQHDVGHAMAAISIAAAGLGWQVTLLDDLSSTQIGTLLGTANTYPEGVEHEEADCILAIYPQGYVCQTQMLPTEAITQFTSLSWQGSPNQLSPDHVDWSMDSIAEATHKPQTENTYSLASPKEKLATKTKDTPDTALRRIIHQRRSAVAFDGQTEISQATFYHILSKTLPIISPAICNVLPWSPHIHLAIFVHRVIGLESGLYLLVRNPSEKAHLQQQMKAEFAWATPPNCPPYLDLYHLYADDMRAMAGQISCTQAIAADGCFSLGMLAKFESPLKQRGPWFYPRLFWESGLVGQILYLEAEAAGIRGTGIGCFFDDAMHKLLGLDDMDYQSLYHFTMGGPVEDSRLTTLPAY